MKPRTAFQKRVVQVNGSLRDINEDYLTRIYKRKCYHVAFLQRKNTFVCGECGKEITITKFRRKGTFVCPECGQKLIPMQSRKWTYRDGYYILALDTYEDLQIFRYYEIDSYAKKYKPVNIWKGEFLRVYVSTEGEMAVCAKRRLPYAYRRYNEWECTSKIELRPMNCQWESSPYHINKPFAICAGKKILPAFKEIGFNGNISKFFSVSVMAKMFRDERCRVLGTHNEPKLVADFDRLHLNQHWKTLGMLMNKMPAGMPANFIYEHSSFGYGIERIANDSRYETLWQLGYYDMVKILRPNELDALWPALRICFRNHYLISNAQEYKDYIQQLIRLDKDIHNAHYVCPENLAQAHYRTNLKIEQLTSKKTYEKERKKIEKANVAYAKRIQPYLSLVIRNAQMQISVLPTVQAFFEEGTAMHHCVYNNGYYKNKDKLIFSCRDKQDRRLATIELDTKHWSIDQVRAACNKVPEKHTQIINLLTRNIGRIQKIAAQQKL